MRVQRFSIDCVACLEGCFCGVRLLTNGTYEYAQWVFLRKWCASERARQEECATVEKKENQKTQKTGHTHGLAVATRVYRRDTIALLFEITAMHGAYHAADGLLRDT